MNNSNNPAEQQINVELSAEVAEGTYSNLAIITHSQSEFIIDFIRIMPGVPKAHVKSRIILTPQHAKRLLGAMNDNIEKYESQFGEIQEHAGGAMKFTLNGPTAEA